MGRFKFFRSHGRDDTTFGIRRFSTNTVYLIIILLLLAAFLLRKSPQFHSVHEFASTVGNETDTSYTGVKDDASEQNCRPVDDGASKQNSRPVDRTLSGLLAPGIDEQSCLSRYESASYRKPSGYKPSRYLLSKLRKYEELHRRCAPHTRLFNESVNRVKTGRGTGPVECNYVVWIANSGLGNQIITIASAFLYALLTNRVLLIEQHNDIASLLCEPIPYASWLLPMEFPVQLTKLDKKHDHCFGNVVKNKLIDRLSFTYFYLHLQWDYNEHDRQFLDDQYQTQIANVPWLLMKTDNYFVPALFLTQTFNQKVEKMFPNKETVFHHLGRYLFHPTNQVWGQITRFYRAYLSAADQVIGLQIRILDSGPHPLQYVMDQLLSCAFNENLLPKLATQQFASTPSKNLTSKAVLVACLHAAYYERLKNMYYTTSAANGEAVGVYQASHEEEQRFGDNAHNMKALAEMNLLSFSDVLVTSGWSTFGYVAQGLGGLKPWIMYKPDKRIVPNPPCRRSVSMEPCFHAPPGFVYHKAKGVSYVRACEDMSWGVKLFDVNS